MSAAVHFLVLYTLSWFSALMDACHFYATYLHGDTDYGLQLVIYGSYFQTLLSFDYNQLSAGTQYTQQSYKVSDTFPFKWINKKWREGFHVTSMAIAGSRWGVVMSRNAGFRDQVGLSSYYISYCPYFPLSFSE